MFDPPRNAPMRKFKCTCGYKGDVRDFPLDPYNPDAKNLCPECAKEIVVGDLLRAQRDTDE